MNTKYYEYHKKIIKMNKYLITLCMFIYSIQGLKAQHCSHAETKTAFFPFGRSVA